MNGIRLHILVLDGQDLKASSFLFPFRHSMKSILWVLMALDSEPFSNPTVCEAEPIVLRSPEAFNFQPCSLTILCSAYLKVIATLPTFECSKAAAAGPAFYLCRAGSKEPEKARGERGKEMQKQFQVCLSVGAHLSSLLGLCLWLPSPTAHRSQPFSIWGWQQGWQLGIERYS